MMEVATSVRLRMQQEVFQVTPLCMVSGHSISLAIGGICTTFLLFTVAPRILEPPSSHNITFKEDDIMLLCNASGFPVPTVSWLHNDSDVTAETRLRIETQVGKRSVLSILMIVNTSVTVNDSGEYVCTASSGITGLQDAVSTPALVLVQGMYIIEKN